MAWRCIEGENVRQIPWIASFCSIHHTPHIEILLLILLFYKYGSNKRINIYIVVNWRSEKIAQLTAFMFFFSSIHLHIPAVCVYMPSIHDTTQYVLFFIFPYDIDRKQIDKVWQKKKLKTVGGDRCYYYKLVTCDGAYVGNRTKSNKVREEKPEWLISHLCLLYCQYTYK